MKKIRVPFNGKGHTISYKVETIDLSMTPVGYMNVYSVFVDDPELEKISGGNFTILHNSTQTIQPCFDYAYTEQYNLRKTIAQQIMNNATE